MFKKKKDKLTDRHTETWINGQRERKNMVLLMKILLSSQKNIRLFWKASFLIGFIADDSKENRISHIK